MTPRPRYFRVLLTFARNSLVRAMTFRANFLIECVTSLSFVFLNLGFFILIFQYTSSIGRGTGWGKYEYFVFLATFQMINSLIEAFFMPNAEEFSELVRTGELDFALMKPIDTQFLISMAKFNWSSMTNFLFALLLLGYSLLRLDYVPGVAEILLYPFYILSGVAILYSLMITLAATTVWLGRNQSIYDFWFYITIFSRYPLEIYSGPFGTPIRILFTFILPVLVVVNVPARLLAKPLEPGEWRLAAFALVATAVSLVASRWLFKRALESYRSASS
ncbi:MAG TPA: ABC-2 family transporter protein [Pirellulales bacterium]|jgi:ABC-2 type transport system permease protein|nr:ABC-2 family transporter protein [Pirellulales bacterium]